MYLSHYSFSAKPFQITADPASIWLGEKHAEALATLQYGLQENNGFLLLTGDVGTGKTTVLNTFLKNIDEKVIAVMIPDPGLDPIDLYNILSAEFRMNRKFSNKGDFLNHLKPFLYETYLQSKTILLIIDEAQNLTSKQMKTLITRAGPGTKVICLGNVAQIDTPYLTDTSSGLTYVVDRFQRWDHAGHITLRRGERSRLAEFASEEL